MASLSLKLAISIFGRTEDENGRANDRHGITCGADTCPSGESRSLLNPIDCCRQLARPPVSELGSAVRVCPGVPLPQSSIAWLANGRAGELEDVGNAY